MTIIALGGVVILLIVVLAYPHIQDMREREIARRLEKIHDPNEAASYLDSARQTTREETGFFRQVLNWIWFPWNRWW